MSSDFEPQTDDLIILSDRLAAYYMQVAEQNNDTWGFYKTDAYVWSKDILSAWLTGRTLDNILDHPQFLAMIIGDSSPFPFNVANNDDHDFKLKICWGEENDDPSDVGFFTFSDSEKPQGIPPDLSELLQKFLDQRDDWSRVPKEYKPQRPYFWSKHNTEDFSKRFQQHLKETEPEAVAIIEQYVLEQNLGDISPKGQKNTLKI